MKIKIFPIKILIFIISHYSGGLKEKSSCSAVKDEKIPQSTCK